MSHSKAKEGTKKKNNQKNKKKKRKPKYIRLYMKISFRLTRTVEDEEHGTTSTLQVVLFSAALGCEATLPLAARASSRAHAGLGGHAASRWWSPPVTLAHQSGSRDASRTSGAPVVAPHVPTLLSTAAGLSLAHRPRLLLLHVQTHLASEHDGLGPQDSLHRVRVVKDHKSKVGELPTDPLGVDPQFDNVSIRHEELFQLALVDVMWEVADEKLLAVWVPDDPPAVHFPRFNLSPATFVDKT